MTVVTVRSLSPPREVRGHVGRLIFRNILGTSVVSPSPYHKEERVRSPAEAATTTSFALAVQRARCVSPEMAARYAERAKQENKTQFSIRTRDAMRPPKISLVYLLGYTRKPGEEILITAHDDSR